MRLDGAGGQFLELSIVGYEFSSMNPAPFGFDHDANWLMIEGRAAEGDRGWTFRAPCLLTTELRELAAWFEAVADEWPDLEEIDFTEPNIAFKRMTTPPDPPVIQVTFSLEARPPWLSSRPVDYEPFTLNFPTTIELTRQVARDLQADLQQFPERYWRLQ